MSHIDVVRKFVEIVRINEDYIKDWIPNGRCSVRIRLKDRSELIFTFQDQKRWRLETIESFKESRLNQARRLMNR